MDVIKKEKVVEIINWAEFQGHIKGDIDIVIETIMKHGEENKE